jgi:sulfonate transport system substrate-binding protein
MGWGWVKVMINRNERVRRMDRGRSLIFSAIALTVFVILFALMNPFQSKQPEFIALDPSDDDHPYYSRFEFDPSPAVINIGTQPLYAPTGIITEALARDSALSADLADLGITVKFFPFLKGSDLNYFIEQGDIDGGFGGDMPALAAIANLKSTAVLLAQHGFTAVVSAEAVYGSELRGKSIGYAPGSNAHHGLLVALDGAGLSIDDVNPIPMDSKDMQHAMTEGLIDAFATWDPFIGNAILENPDWNILSRSFSSGYFYLSDDLISRHPAAASALVAAGLRAIKLARSGSENGHVLASWNAESASEFYGDEFQLTADDIWRISSEDLMGSSIDPILDGRQYELLRQLASEYEFLIENGYIDSPAPWDDVSKKFDSDVSDDARSQ